MADIWLKWKACALKKQEPQLMTIDFREEALHYHRQPSPGKIGIHISKPTHSQNDLSLAYTPGVAEPVREIVNNPEHAYQYTNKGNLVAVITDGSAVLGLGNVGALASKPVMEGKAVLFKKFANIDVYDIEINATSAQAFMATVQSIAPTFGGINLEDIKAPECFEIEQFLQQQLTIPVFHDDQHGTAIIIAAGLLNALEIQNKLLANTRIVCLGAGAAGIASMRLLTALGAKHENMLLIDRKGVIHHDRKDLNAYKLEFANQTTLRTLDQAIEGADVFIGVSGPNLLTANMLRTMAKNPIIFALSNPDPEIHPEIAHATRDDIIMATGRSDYPNQVNNVLCFPYIFRGALDVRATCINAEMQIAAVHAIREITHEAVPKEIAQLYTSESDIHFGPNYIIPKPMDPRLLTKVPPAVSEAAIRSKVALNKGENQI